MSAKPDTESACRDAIRHWSSLLALVGFARERHGYTDTDGGFGVAYPGELDEYDREHDGQFIPPGYLVVVGFRGPPDGYEMFVAERVYLEVLARVLCERGFGSEADEVLAIRNRIG